MEDCHCIEGQEVTEEQYGENLEENIENLLVRMKKSSYKPYPACRAHIPKGNEMRRLGILSFEDKVVQGVFKEILDAIYVSKFKELSFGFYPNRRCHNANQRVDKTIAAGRFNYILDVDIKGFFDNIHQYFEYVRKNCGRANSAETSPIG